MKHLEAMAESTVSYPFPAFVFGAIAMSIFIGLAKFLQYSSTFSVDEFAGLLIYYLRGIASRIDLLVHSQIVKTTHGKTLDDEISR